MMTNQDILRLAIYLTSAVVAGLIVRKWVVPLLVKITRLTRWKSDDIIIDSIKNWIIFWFILAGVALALPAIHIATNYRNTIERILIASIIFSVTWIIARIISQLIALKTNVGGISILPSSSIISNIVRIIIYAVGFLFLLQSLGISITPLLTALGVGGLAVALALQQTLTNLFAGIQIIASGKLKPNDYIQLSSGEEGYIQDIAWRSTTVKALPNHIIIIPNSKMAEAIVRNFSLPENEIAVFVNVGVSYDSDLEKVERVTNEVAAEVLKNVQGAVSEFTPFIRFNNFGESSIDFSVILRAREYVDQYLVKHEFIKQLQKRYRQENIEIPFPIRTVYMKQSQ